MDIFVINTDKSDSISNEMLNQYGYKTFSDKNKEKAHRFAYLMLNRILTIFYNITNAELEFVSGKPVLKKREKNFSISHSEKYIALAFSDYDCGLDIENIKQRDYEKISSRMGFKANSLKDFYICWTEYEAKYKLKVKAESVYSFEIPDYIITAVCINSEEKFEIYYNL